MSVNFLINANTRNFTDGMDNVRNSVRQTMDYLEQQGARVESTLQKIAGAAGVAFSLQGAKSFIDKVVEMRSFFQDIESSMKVFLGNQEKAAEFTQKLKDYAYYNMFEFKDLAAASQQMIAYGVEIDDIIPKIDQLSNIAVGTHGSLMDLVAAYNKAKSTGVVDAQGVQSWAVKGVVIRDVLKEIGEEATTTSITFDQLNKVLDHVTGEGGMFHNLQMEMMENISAEIGQFEDNFNAMLNEIGEKYQKEIVDAIKFGSELVDDYEKIGKYIMDAVVAYGAYKTALIVTNTAQKAHVLWLELSQTAMLQNKLATEADIIAKGKATVATVVLDRAQKALNASMIATPYGMIGLAVGALVFGIYKLATAEDVETAARRRANEQMEEFKQKLDEQKNRINSYIQTIKDVNSTEYQKVEAWEALNKEAPTITKAYTMAELKALDLGEAQKKVNEAMEEADYQNTIDQVKKYREQVDLIQKHLANPSRDMHYDLEYEKNLKHNISLLNEWQEKLNKIEALRKEVSEKARPIEIRVYEANNNLKTKQEILDFYDKAMVLAKKVEEANDDISFDKVAVSAQTNKKKALDEFNEFIEEVKKELDNPLSPKFDGNKEGQQRLYNELLSVKESWKDIFKTPIPIWFKINYANALKDVEDASSGNRPGMHFVESILGKETNGGKRGYWEADEDEKSLTIVQLRTNAYQNLLEKRRELAKFDKDNKNADKSDNLIKKRTELLNAVSAAEKTYKEAGGSIKNGGKNTLNERKKQQAQEIIEERRYQEEFDDIRQKAVDARTDATIAAIENDSERQRAEQDEQHKRNLRQIEEQADEMRKAIYEHNKKVWETSHKDSPYELTEAGKAGWSDIQLSDDQDKIIKAQTDKENAEYNRILLERHKANIQSMRDYLKEYGSFYQKQLAITDEYEEKIRDARAKGDKGTEKLLLKQRQKDLASAKVSDITMGLDWSALASGVGNMIPQMMKPMLDKLEAYIKTDEFNGAGLENQQKVSELITELHKYVDSDYQADWRTLSDAITRFNTATEAYQNAKIAEQTAVNIRDNKKKAFERGEISEDEYKIAVRIADGLGDATAKARESMEQYAKEINTTTTAITNSTSNLTKALEKSGVWKLSDGFGGLEQFSEVLDNFKSEAQKSIAGMDQGGEGENSKVASAIVNGVSDVGDVISSGIESVMNTGIGQILGIIAQIPGMILQFANTIKNFVTGILDGFTELLKFEWLSDLVNSILDSVGNLIQAIFDLPANLVNSIGSIVTDGVGGLLHSVANTITFGGFDSLLGIGSSNRAEIEEANKKLENATNVNTEAIKRLTDEIKSQKPSEAYKDYEDAVRLMKINEQNRMRVMHNNASMHDGGHSLWSDYKDYGGFYYYTDISALMGGIPANYMFKSGRGISAAMYAYLGKNPYDGSYDIGSMVHDFTAEDWNRLLKEKPEWMTQLGEIIAAVEDDGNYNGIFQDILDFANEFGDDAYEELKNTLQEAVTGVSFDSFKDKFKSSLMDMKKDAGDFKDDFTEMLMESVLDAQIKALYGDRLQELYDLWSNALEDDRLTDDELAQLKEMEESLANDMIKTRDELANYTGYDKTSQDQQSATANSIQNISYDQADSLIGINTAQLIALEQGNGIRDLILQNLQAMSDLANGKSQDLSEIKNLVMQGNATREIMLKAMKEHYKDFTTQMNKILSELQNQ